MREQDAGVATARWESEPAIALIATVRDGLAAFAAAHGMTRDTREDVRSFVSEAMADAFARLRRDDEPGSVTVDAATDGAWLSVRVKDVARMRGAEPSAGLPLVSCLPHRLDWAADAAGTYVLMEFAMRPSARRVARSDARDARTARCFGGRSRAYATRALAGRRRRCR